MNLRDSQIFTSEETFSTIASYSIRALIAGHNPNWYENSVFDNLATISGRPVLHYLNLKVGSFNTPKRGDE
jgi:hypothetical protein